MINIKKNNICGIIVTYNIGENYLDNFNSLKNQVDKIVIIDNNSCKKTLNIILKIKNNNPNKVILIKNNKNFGLAKAQNQGIEYAIKNNYDWVLLLDHDSLLDHDMIKKMSKKYNPLSENRKKRIGLVSPVIFDKNTNEYSKIIIKDNYLIKRINPLKVENKYVVSALTVIASGSLIKTKVLKEIGVMREDFFIDYIDIEFCLRLKENNYNIMVVINSILRHELGERKTIKFGIFKITPQFHSPSRLYYIFKNRTIIWKKYYFKQPVYIIYDILVSIYDIIRIFFEDNKLSKFKMIFKGLIKGIKY